MLKVSRKISVTLSLILAFVVGVGAVSGSVLLPSIVKVLITAHDSVDTLVPDFFKAGEPLLLVLAYIALVCILVADVLMICLLFRVRDGKVFTLKSVGLIRGVSWCSMLLGVAFAVIGLYFILGFVVAGLAVFLGLCLRVVKNVVEEATAIKSENDLTV